MKERGIILSCEQTMINKWDMIMVLKPNERKTTTEIQDELRDAGINCVGVKVDTMFEQPNGSKVFTLEISEENQ